MLRRCIVQRYWFYDLHAKELTENYHLRKPDISESYTRQSQALDRVTKDTPPAELSPFEHALKQAVTPISDTLPVPRHADPCYLSVNGESIPQSWKFLPNNQMYEHLENCHLRWKLHPFQSLISEHPSGYMEPLGPVKGNEDLPYAVLRTHMGKLPLVMRFRVNYRFSALQILNVSGDKEALVDDLRDILPNKRIIMKRDRIELHKCSYDVARVVQHYLFSLGY